MLRRALALLVLAAGFTMTACADVTGPDTDTTPSLSSCGGVYAGTGTCSR